MVFRTWLVSFFKFIYFSSSFHLLTLIQSYLSPSTLFFTDTQCQGLEWDGCVWPAVTVPLPDWDYNTLQILTLLSTLKAAFWRCTLERVKEIWKEGPALCLEGLHLSPCPQGSFCVCACLGICMHVMFIRGTNTWLTGPPFLSWDRELYIMVRYRLGLGSF